MANKKLYTTEKYNKDMRIVKYIEKRRVDLDNDNRDLEAKIIFLTKGMGWKNLKVNVATNNNKYKPIYQCEPERINSVVKRTYYDAKKRLTHKPIDYVPKQFELGFYATNSANDILRLDALASQNALSYYNTCNLLGVDPEDTFLYERGAADFQYEKNNVKK